MPRYRSKPTSIEAEQWLRPGQIVKGMCGSHRCPEAGRAVPHVHTAHGGQAVYLELGDFIVPEPNGAGFYPIKPDIFAAKYELEPSDEQS
jgi:hypothetical protein